MHAKWAFVLLAFVFAFGFVFFGVGSGSTGVSDALQNAFHFGGNGGTSISKAERKTRQHPQDAQAWRDLATAYEQKQRPQDAVNALERYTALRPKDTGGLQELAAQYSQLAQKYSSDYSAAQAEALGQQSPASVFAPPASTPFGKAFSDSGALKDPIGAAVQDLVSQKQNTAYANYQSAQRNAESAYKKMAALSPNDATTQIQLGQAAQAANDPTTAIQAFEKFLKLAPSDPLAPQVKAAIKQLKGTSAASSG